MNYKRANEIVDKELYRSAVAIFRILAFVIGLPLFLAVWIVGLPCRLVLWLIKEWNS